MSCERVLGKLIGDAIGARINQLAEDFLREVLVPWQREVQRLGVPAEILRGRSTPHLTIPVSSAPTQTHVAALTTVQLPLGPVEECIVEIISDAIALSLARLVR